MHIENNEELVIRRLPFLSRSEEVQVEAIDVGKLRQQLGLTPKQMADQFHVAKRTVLRWEQKLSVPRGPARNALLEMQWSLQGGVSRSNGIRVGVCAEFTDTLLPMLARRFGRPTEFVPIPWDGRVMSALHSGFVNGVLFNEYCAQRYAHDTATCLEFVGEPSISGAPYIGFSLPGSVPSADLLSVLWHPQTIKIVPYADMDATMRLVREGCCRAGGELQTLATQDDEDGWFRCSAGHGVRLFLHPPAFWGNVPIAYIGGQDQRARIELAQEQITDRTIVVLTEPGQGLDVELPDSLRTNRLVGVGQSARMLDVVADAISESRQAVCANEAVRDDALTELVRWQYLHGSLGGGEFRDIRREFDATLPRTRMLSAELGRWF